MPAKRAKKGTIAGSIELRLPADLRHAAEVCAADEGVSVAEWWRRAGRDRALRQARGRPELQARLADSPG